MKPTREQCLKWAEEAGFTPPENRMLPIDAIADLNDCAAAIRARSEK